MTWITVMRMEWAEEDVPRARELLAKHAPTWGSATTRWRRNRSTITIDYGTDSKYGPVRPSVALLEETFDPIARSDYYEPWPLELSLRTFWREA